MRCSSIVTIAIAALATFAGDATAQVFKCKGANGEVVYSQHACGTGAQEVRVKSSRPATRTDGEIANRDAVFRSTDLSDSSIAERNCVASARSSIYGPVESRIAGYQRQIAQLNRELSTAANNLAGATFESGIRGQISGLQQSISTERMTAESSMNSARQRCSDERRLRETAIDKKYER